MSRVRSGLGVLGALGLAGLIACAAASGPEPSSPAPETAPRASAAARERLSRDFFFRGVSFSHEGWRGGGGGYGSSAADEQLRRLRDMGTNAIAVVPYGFMRGADADEIFYRGTDESDDRLASVLASAHALGFKVMLKPQIWVGHGVFTGDVQRDRGD